MARRSPSPLSAYEEHLRAEQARIAREVAEAEKALRRTPKTAPQTKPEPERKVRLNNVAGLQLHLPRPQDHIIRDAGSVASRRRSSPRRRKSDVRQAQMNFLLLCLLLAAIALFVYLKLPL